VSDEVAICVVEPPIRDYRIAAPFWRAIYKRKLDGCCLHVAIDDGNLDNRSITWCLQEACDAGHRDCAHLAQLLLAMSMTQRKKAYGKSWLWKLPADRLGAGLLLIP
jgi:hypothetical protein